MSRETLSEALLLAIAVALFFIFLCAAPYVPTQTEPPAVTAESR